MQGISTALALIFLTFSSDQPQAKLTQHDLKEIECLAKNLYFETGSQDHGPDLITEVVFNRVDDPRFPNTVCGVVYQRKQFSWTHDNKSDIPKWKQAYNKLYAMAKSFYLYRNKLPNTGAQFYHADYVNPRWAKNMQKVAVRGRHIFYRYD